MLQRRSLPGTFWVPNRLANDGKFLKSVLSLGSLSNCVRLSAVRKTMGTPVPMRAATVREHGISVPMRAATVRRCQEIDFRAVLHRVTY